MSARARRRALAAAVAVVAVVVTLWLLHRRRSDAPAEDATAAAADRARDPGVGARGAAPPRERRVNDLGQPLDEQGRPIGPGHVQRYEARRDLLDVPLTPPRFDDPQDRAEYRRWWIDELARRAAVFARIVPRGDYPTAEDTARLLGDYYDAAEPRAAGESVEDALARSHDRQRLWEELRVGFGEPLMTISSRGGDPQYGKTLPPPIDPDHVAPEVPPPVTTTTPTPPPGGPPAPPGPP